MNVKFYVEPEDLKGWHMGESVFLRFINPENKVESNTLDSRVVYIDYGRSVVEVSHNYGHFPSNFILSVGRFETHEIVR